MFIKKNEAEKNSAKSTRPAGTVSTIAAGTTINGDIESDSDMRIDGNIIGNVFCKAKIVLGESGIQGLLSVRCHSPCQKGRRLQPSHHLV